MLATDQLSQMGKFRWLQVSFCKTPQGSFEIENYPRRIQSKSQAIICKSNNTFSLAHFYMAVHNLRIWSMLHIQTLRYDHLPSSFKLHIHFPMIPHDWMYCNHITLENTKYGGREMHSPPLAAQINESTGLLVTERWLMVFYVFWTALWRFLNLLMGMKGVNMAQFRLEWDGNLKIASTMSNRKPWATIQALRWLSASTYLGCKGRGGGYTFYSLHVLYSTKLFSWKTLKKYISKNLLFLNLY